jgi:hypothetical protein
MSYKNKLLISEEELLMAFGNNRNQNNKINTTTKVVQMYNPSGEDAGTLTLGYWNTFATIRINPALPENQRQDGKVYNYDANASVILNAETAIALLEGVNKIEALIKAKKKAPAVAVRTQQFVVKVGRSDDYEGMDGDFYLGLFEVDNKGVATGSMFYPFVQHEGATESTLMFGWDEDTGNHKAVTLNTQWKAFKNFLEQASKDLISGGSHGSTSQLNIWISRLTTAIDVVKGMIETASFGGGRSQGNNQGGGNSGGGFGGGGFSSRRKRDINLGGGSSSSDGGNSGRGNRGGRNKAKEESIDDISDIENEMMDELNDIDDM